jgi:hypothetical protein
VCLKLDEVDQATVTATAKSTFLRDACAKPSDLAAMRSPPAKTLGSLYYEGAMSRPSPNKEIISPTISSVGAQLEAVRVNGQCTIQLIEPLVDMVSKLTEEVTHLKNGNIFFNQEIENLHSLMRPPLWSSGQSFWLQIRRPRVRFPALPDFLRSRGLERGPLSLMRTIEELLE